MAKRPLLISWQGPTSLNSSAPFVAICDQPWRACPRCTGQGLKPARVCLSPPYAGTQELKFTAATRPAALGFQAQGITEISGLLAGVLH